MVKLEELKLSIEKDANEANKIKEVVEADKKKIEADNERISKEATACKKDLDASIPILEEATKALDSIRDKDIKEVMSYKEIKDIIRSIMDCVCIIMQKPVSQTINIGNMHFGKLD